MPKQDERFLFIDTSGPEALIALISKKGGLEEKRHEARWTAGRELSATLALKVKKLLKESNTHLEDLSGILVYPGPGSFTGLRIGISFANAFAFAHKIPSYVADKDGCANLKNPERIILPRYSSEPKITKPKGASCQRLCVKRVKK